MRNARDLIQSFSRMTGIRDPKVDAWFGIQALYAKHGMEHPALEKRREPERRSRSPMLPGPRSTKSLDDQLFEKWMDERYPRDLMPRYSSLDYVINWGPSSWWQSSVFTDDSETYYLRERGQVRPRGRGVITGIHRYDENPSRYTYRTDAEAQEAVFRIEAEARYQQMLNTAKRLQDEALRKVFTRGFRFDFLERGEDDEGRDDCDDS